MIDGSYESLYNPDGKLGPNQKPVDFVLDLQKVACDQGECRNFLMMAPNSNIKQCVQHVGFIGIFTVLGFHPEGGKRQDEHIFSKREISPNGVSRFHLPRGGTAQLLREGVKFFEAYRCKSSALNKVIAGMERALLL